MSERQGSSGDLWFGLIAGLVGTGLGGFLMGIADGRDGLTYLGWAVIGVAGTAASICTIGLGVFYGLRGYHAKNEAR